MTDNENLVAVRNQTGTSQGRWHIFKAENIEDVHHNAHPVCGQPNNLEELKSKSRKLDHVEASDLEELKEKTDGKFGEICKRCWEYIAGEYTQSQKVTKEMTTDKYGTGRSKLDDWREKTANE